MFVDVLDQVYSDTIEHQNDDIVHILILEKSLQDPDWMEDLKLSCTAFCLNIASTIWRLAL